MSDALADAVKRRADLVRVIADLNTQIDAAKIRLDDLRAHRDLMVAERAKMNGDIKALVAAL